MDSHWTVRILCSSDEDFCLAVRGDQVVTTIVDHRDKFQYWIKDERHSTEGEDGRRRSFFSLVNLATGLAIQECVWEENVKLPLVRYKHKTDSPDMTTKVAVWTASDDTDPKGFHSICRADDVSLLIYLKEAPQDGNAARLGTRSSSGTLRWKFVLVRDKMQVYPVPVDTALQARVLTHKNTVKICCSAKKGHNMTIHNDTVMLAPSNPGDRYQHWIKETAYCQHVKDKFNNKAFVLLNKATGKAIGHGLGPKNHVRLVQFNPRYLDPTILWTEKTDFSHDFREIRMLTNTSAALDCFNTRKQRSSLSLVGIWDSTGSDNQLWKIEDSD